MDEFYASELFNKQVLACNLFKLGFPVGNYKFFTILILSEDHSSHRTYDSLNTPRSECAQTRQLNSNRLESDNFFTYHIV